MTHCGSTSLNCLSMLSLDAASAPFWMTSRRKKRTSTGDRFRRPLVTRTCTLTKTPALRRRGQQRSVGEPIPAPHHLFRKPLPIAHCNPFPSYRLSLPLCLLPYFNRPPPRSYIRNTTTFPPLS